jgi:FlaG/FlaF family flagellin (archaellin)
MHCSISRYKPKFEEPTASQATLIIMGHECSSWVMGHEYCCPPPPPTPHTHTTTTTTTTTVQGYLVGNGVTDDEFDGNAYLPFAAGKSLISELTLQRASQACGGHFWNGTRGSRCADVTVVWGLCARVCNPSSGTGSSRSPLSTVLH